MDQKAKLTFGELKEGERFIVLPIPGDNHGHGGLRTTHCIFLKTRRIEGFHGGYDNSVKLSTGIFSGMPDSMPVIRVE